MLNFENLDPFFPLLSLRAVMKIHTSILSISSYEGTHFYFVDQFLTPSHTHTHKKKAAMKMTEVFRWTWWLKTISRTRYHMRLGRLEISRLKPLGNLSDKFQEIAEEGVAEHSWEMDLGHEDWHTVVPSSSASEKKRKSRIFGIMVMQQKKGDSQELDLHMSLSEKWEHSELQIWSHLPEAYTKVKGAERQGQKLDSQCS